MSEQHYRVETFRAQSSVGYHIKRAHSLMLDVMEPLLAARGFSFVQYVVLAWLRDGLVVNPKEICALYRHDSGAMTRLIDQLADRGFVERLRGDRDRRTVELKLTDAGREAIDRLIPLMVEKLNCALADFSAEEVHELMRLLLKLNTTLLTMVEPAAHAVA